MTDRALVIGLGVTGEAVARHLLRAGTEVVVVDDRPTGTVRARAAALGVTLVEAPDADALAATARGCDQIVVSPGVPASHPVFSQQGPPPIGEVELAARSASVPILAVTGTNGKTTVTTLIAEMLERSGRRALAAGNIGRPLIDAVDCPAGEVDVIVAELSSFQLYLTDRFRPHVSVWLNLSEDHLDWHPDFAHYRAAKARLWANTSDGDVLLGNADDATVMDELRQAQGRRRTFGLEPASPVSGWPHYGLKADALCTPESEPIVAVRDLARQAPHELSNVLAAAGAALAAGATVPGCGAAALAYRGLPHRIELVRDAGGVRWYDDSKATTPASVVAALRAFPSVVLIAGGRNKGLDFRALRAEASRLRGVVAIGESAPEVADAVGDVCRVVAARSMSDAVDAAAAMAADGDAVLLSPGAASFDWYGSYAERGDDFARLVGALGPGSGGER